LANKCRCQRPQQPQTSCLSVFPSSVSSACHTSRQAARAHSVTLALISVTLPFISVTLALILSLFHMSLLDKSLLAGYGRRGRGGRDVFTCMHVRTYIDIFFHVPFVFVVVVLYMCVVLSRAHRGMMSHIKHTQDVSHETHAYES